jgi:hypothetical protein
MILLEITGALKGHSRFRTVILVLWIVLWCAPSLVFGVAGLCIPAARFDPLTEWALIICPPVIGVAFRFFKISCDTWFVTEFTCDDETFRYRRFGQASFETRHLWEVQRIESDKGWEWKPSSYSTESRGKRSARTHMLR